MSLLFRENSNFRSDLAQQMETGLKLLQLNRMLKHKAAGKRAGSSGKKTHDEKDIQEIDKMVFSDSSDEGDMDINCLDLDKAIEC